MIDGAGSQSRNGAGETAGAGAVRGACCCRWLGSAEVLQQTPLTVTAEPPSAATFPPLIALLVVIDDTVEVVTVGIVTGEAVVKDMSAPYAVPTMLVA